MKYSLLQNRFNTWEPAVKDFIESDAFDKLSLELSTISNNVVRCPEVKHTFRAFQCCDYNTLKAVIVLQDPYFSKSHGTIIADGIALSCSITDHPQPSLINFKNEIQRTVYDGLNLTLTYANNDLLYLEEQGVLLLNAALTVELGKAGSHIKLWEQFTKNLLTNISSQKENIAFALLGAFAHKLDIYIDKSKHTVIRASHPASAAYSGGVWDSKDMFNEINKVVEKRNLPKIIW